MPTHLSCFTHETQETCHVFAASHGHCINISWNVTILCKQKEICSRAEANAVAPQQELTFDVTLMWLQSIVNAPKHQILSLDYLLILAEWMVGGCLQFHSFPSHFITLKFSSCHYTGLRGVNTKPSTNIFWLAFSLFFNDGNNASLNVLVRMKNKFIIY